MKTLNLIGCGHVGKTLGFLLRQSGYQIQTILTRSQQSGDLSRAFIGAGQPVTTYEKLLPANSIFIAVQEDQLSQVIENIAESDCIEPGTIIFHCSGSFSHQILMPLKVKDVLIASLHPIKAFSDPESDIHTFKNTYCALEGDEAACKILRADFEKIGGKIVEISAENKLLYHIATIFSSNYLVALIDASLALLAQTGIPREIGFPLLEPLIMNTFFQVKKSGTEKALTGPIARGDADLIARQQQALAQADSSLINPYNALGKLALDLAIRKQSLSEAAIQTLEEHFK